MKTIFTLIYFLGLLSCTAQGIYKAADKCSCAQSCYASAFLSSFAGGLIRDIMILHVYPVIFTSDCIPDIMVVVISIFLCTRYFHNQKQVKSFVTFTDCIGMARFLVIGVDRALSIKNNYALAILSGVCTSMGGGIVTSLIFSGESIRQIMLANLSYRLFSVLGTVLYATLIKSAADPIDAQIAMIIYTLCTLPICGNLGPLKKRGARALHIAQNKNTYANWDCLSTIVLLYSRSRQFYSKLPSVTDVSNHFKIHNSKRIIYLYHRIRQM